MSSINVSGDNSMAILPRGLGFLSKCHSDMFVCGFVGVSFGFVLSCVCRGFAKCRSLGQSVLTKCLRIHYELEHARRKTVVLDEDE
jgi:hypothetical protein